MTHLDYFQLLLAAAPETILVVATLAILGIDLFILRDSQLQDRFFITGAFGCLACLAALFWNWNGQGHETFFAGVLVTDPLIRLVKVGVLALAVFTLLLSVSAPFTEHVGEYVALVLLATLGMLFMIGSEELLTIFVALELTSLSLYVLTAYQKEKRASTEAALKYFLFGSMSAAFTLFGLSLVYGLSGSTHLREIAESLKGQGLSPLLVTAMVMTVIGFGFKVAAVPFHLWAPDTYQGAPTPVAAFVASGSKVASFFVFAKIMMVGFAGFEGSGAWQAVASGWIPALAIIAALSMILGNLAAIVQSSVKRLLAYSAVAHAGYALLGIAANSREGMASLVYYVVTYGLTVLGAFGVVYILEQQQGTANMSDFAGLSRRAPLLSFCMLIFMLSLAGIPPLAGFFGKFYVFAATAGATKNLGLLWLVILAIGMSAVSLYYYLQVLKQIYVADPPVQAKLIRIPVTSAVALITLASAVVVLGCAPDLFLGRLVKAIKLAGL